MKRKLSPVLGLLALFSSLVSSGAAFVADESNPTSTYRVYTFNKPANFDTLEGFVNETYGDVLDQSTIRQTNVDGQPAISYWTVEGGIRQFSLLIQGEAGLSLMTSAQLDLTQDTEPTVMSTAASTTAPTSMRPLSVSVGPVFNSCTTAANGSNCVAYARCLAPWLPKIDLTTFVAKKSLINASAPSIGAVAVIQVTGQFAINGHLAYVTGINYNAKGQVSTITITESHYVYSNGFDIRTDTPANLHVVGYIIRR